MESFRLDEYEKSQSLFFTSSVTTLTLYKYMQSTDPETFLRKRFLEIVQRNPWIMGRIVRRNGNLYCEFDPYPQTLRYDCFHCVHDTNLDKTSLSDPDYLKHTSTFIDKYNVKYSKDCIDNNGPLCTLTIVKNDITGCFYFSFSCCHLIIDGKTYYLLYSMFDFRTQPYSLIFDRFAFKSVLKELNFTETSDNFFMYLSRIIGIIRNSFFRVERVWTLGNINSEWILSQKKLMESSQLSTNDILSFFFFLKGGEIKENTNCMVVNFRNKIQSITDLHAGNYAFPVAYEKSEYYPDNIKKSVSFIKYYATTKLNMFSILYGNIVLVTNWSSIYSSVGIPCCELIYHMPILSKNILKPFKLYVCIFNNGSGLSVITSSCTDINFYPAVSPLFQTKICTHFGSVLQLFSVIRRHICRLFYTI